MTEKEFKLLSEENKRFLEKQLNSTRCIIKILGYSSLTLSCVMLYLLMYLKTLLS